MASFSSIFAVRNLLVLSVALNATLLLRLLHEGGNGALAGFFPDMPKNGAEQEAHLSQGTRLSITDFSASSFFASTAEESEERVINLDHGDPTMYETFWRRMGDRTTIVISGWQTMSYFSDIGNLCWFLEPEFAQQIIRLHKVVGNAVTENRHIVVGTGSSQLFQAALYALSPMDATDPISVVSAAPYYSSYPLITDCLKSGLHKWAGDARSFNKSGPYIELITSPNNPDGFVRHSVVNQSEGMLVHDLAYYWPQYTPITSPADYELMLFTVSKCTGHAGTRIGWALVKDEQVARKMVKFIELSTIGVSKDSQLRAAQVLKVASDSCESHEESGSFFDYSYQLMAKRWKQLTEAVQQPGLFSMPDIPPQFCSFYKKIFKPQPAFAWVKCEGEIHDCEGFFRENKILVRSGKHFGDSPKLVRINMLDREQIFEAFVRRIQMIQM
ncbi:hypothetical protein SLE2022_293310 [Rubroshorea leprosula]